MPEPNPYESPKEDEPLSKERLLKRGIGVGLILMLTPVAMVIATLASCFADRVALSVPEAAFTLPIIILTGLMIWATILDRPRRDDPNTRPSRIGWLLATPFVVVGAAILAYMLAALIVLATSRQGQGLNEGGMLAAVVVFWGLIGTALIVMLWTAWRAGR